MENAESSQRFPRGPLELLILETLEALAPMAVSPLQLSGMISRPHVEVRNILSALANLATIAHPAKGLYRHGPPDEVRPTTPPSTRPSTEFAATIAALCAPKT